MKTYYLSHSDLENFQSCPWIINKFKNKIKNTLKISDVYKDAAKSLLFSEFSNVSTYNNIVRAYMAAVKRHELTGSWQIRQFNDLNIVMKRFYFEFIKEIREKNYQIVAMGLPLLRTLTKTVYSTEIAAVLVNEQQKMVPLHILHNDEYKKSNYIRFANALLEEKTGYPVKEYFVILLPETLLGGLSILNIQKEGSASVLNELDNALELFQIEYNTPNTMFCKYCPVKQFCRF